MSGGEFRYLVVCDDPVRALCFVVSAGCKEQAERLVLRAIEQRGLVVKKVILQEVVR